MTESAPETPPRPDPEPDAQADPEWFREPSPREHWIAFGLFLGFGIFFVLLFFVTAGFWFRWVTLGLGFYSTLHAFRHARRGMKGAEGSRMDTNGHE